MAAPVPSKRETICRACLSREWEGTFRVTERMIGLGTVHPYARCAKCGSLTLVEQPSDLSQYYGPGYYTHRLGVPKVANCLARSFNRHRFKAWSGGKDWLGAWFNQDSPPPDFVGWLMNAGIGFDDHILDIGCGEGRLLMRLFNFGFNHLTGIDPFLDPRLQRNQPIRLLRASIDDLNEPFDHIMVHHVLEHLDDPDRFLRATAQRLKSGGFLQLRLPVADGEAHRRYGVNWVQWDAPRHIFIPTRAGLEILIARSGWRIVRKQYDSTAFQFWGSELYCQGTPLSDSRSPWANPFSRHFSEAEIAAWEAEAQHLNEVGQGDQICLLLQPIPA